MSFSEKVSQIAVFARNKETKTYISTKHSMLRKGMRRIFFSQILFRQLTVLFPLFQKPFQCDQCGKRFYSTSLLGAHKQNHDNTTYPCKVCGRVFNIPSGYRRHMQIHRKDQSFECTICFKSFSTRVYLTRHVHKHNEKKFQCSFCETKFNTAKGKRIHEKTRHDYDPPI